MAGDTGDSTASSDDGSRITRRTALGIAGTGVLGAGGTLAAWRFLDDDSTGSSASDAAASDPDDDQDQSSEASDSDGGDESTDGSTTFSPSPLLYGKSGEDLVALDASDGSEVWATTYDFVTLSDYFSVADGLLYAGARTSDDTGAVVAYDAATGERQWRFDEPTDWVSGGVSVAGETAFVGSLDQQLYALDRTTGAKQWSSDCSSYVNSAPAVANGTVFVPAGLDVVAFDAASGDERWRKSPSNGSGYGTPQVVDGTVYAAASDLVVGLDVETGEYDLYESFEYDIVGFQDVTVKDEMLLVGAPSDPELLAVDTTTGDVLWSLSQPEHGLLGAPTIADDIVFACFGDISANEGELFAVDASDGAVEWSMEFDGSAAGATPTVHDSTVYVDGEGDTLYALHDTTGTEQWSVDLGDKYYSYGTTVVTDPVNGSGVGSRSRLYNHAHHRTTDW